MSTLPKKQPARAKVSMKPLLLFAVSLLVACGGAAGGGGGNTGGVAPSAQVTVTFPNLFDQGGTKVLPTYISHVVTSERYPLASVAITNTGPATTVAVEIDLPTYGSPTTQTISLAASESKTISISPSIDYTQLFANTTALPAHLNISVTAGSTSLFQQSYPIQISGRDTVFWANDGQSAVPLVATMVTPTDKANAITNLLHGAAARFPGGALPGYSGVGTWPSEAYGPIAPGLGNQQQEIFVILAGESPTVTIDSVVNGIGGADTASVFIVDDANYQLWASGLAATGCAVNNAATAGSVLTCTTPPVGIYHVVYFNPASNLTSRTITRHRPMMQIETTIAESQAIFEQLRAEGLTYANLPGTGFFASSQNVMYPSESLAAQSANCIEGSVLFASAWERLGMEPVLAIGPTHGHAFVGVHCWAGTTTCVVPIETTMVGSSATFNDAYTTALTNWSAWTSDGSLVPVDIKAMRAIGLTPAPM